MMADAAQIRGTGIAQRQPEYIKQKIEQGKAIIALHKDKLIGFCYIESWQDQKYVANSGLIVHPDYRNEGLAKVIKKATFDLSKKMFPNALLFGITTSMAVMKINSDLGYRPVTFSELTTDETFWKGCQSCNNYDILMRTSKSMCLCTGMICDLSKETNRQLPKKLAWTKFKEFFKERLKVKSKQLLNLTKITSDVK
ncbi:N-acetyltransferase [Fulvivirga sp. RKSG066]|nr:GNAT family N-acetyltransferase [Fulvivirga aurantia]MTI22504.1 N-acetyltransferase [Fulvivirga aurantia]